MLKIPLYHLVQGVEWSLAGVCVVIILKVKRPCTTEQFKDNKHSDEYVAEQKTCNQPNTSTSPYIRWPQFRREIYH